MTSSPYMLVEDVAVLLGCSKRTIHERARLSEIPHRRMPSSRRLLFVSEEISQWLDGAALEASSCREAVAWCAHAAEPGPREARSPTGQLEAGCGRHSRRPVGPTHSTGNSRTLGEPRQAVPERHHGRADVAGLAVGSDRAADRLRARPRLDPQPAQRDGGRRRRVPGKARAWRSSASRQRLALREQARGGSGGDTLEAIVPELTAGGDGER